jgi:hypothetical protein
MARFRLSGHNLRIATGSHEGLPHNERSCCRCKRFIGEDFVAPIDDKEHLLFLRSPLCGAETPGLPLFVVVVVVVLVVVAYILGSCAALSLSLHPVPLPISFF